MDSEFQLRTPPHRRIRAAGAAPPSPDPEDDVITGTILPYGGSSAPEGYLECDGSAVSRVEYAALFAVLGTAYGPGDGSTTFNVPDFRCRTLLGAGPGGGGLTARNRGDSGGAESHVLTVQEMPGHAHGYEKVSAFETSAADGDPGSGNSYLVSATLSTAGENTLSVGGGQAHENLPPFGVVRWIVKA